MLAVALALLLGSSACFTIRSVRHDVVDDLAPGATTRAEIEEWLGPPAPPWSEPDEEGRIHATYVDTRSVRPFTLETRRLSVSLRDGILVGYSFADESDPLAPPRGVVLRAAVLAARMPRERAAS